MKRVLKVEDWFHPDGFPISVVRREPQGAFEPHAHEFAELVIVMGGTCLHVSGQESWELTAGDVFVINADREHEYRDLENLRLVNILYQPGQLKMRLLDLASVAGYHALFTLEPSRKTRQPTRGRMHLNSRELVQALELVDQLHGELEAREPGFGFMANATFMQLIGQLSRFYGSNPSPDGKALLRVGEALSHLERNIHNEVNLRNWPVLRTCPREVFFGSSGLPPVTHHWHGCSANGSTAPACCCATPTSRSLRSPSISVSTTVTISPASSRNPPGFLQENTARGEAQLSPWKTALIVTLPSFPATVSREIRVTPLFVAS